MKSVLSSIADGIFSAGHRLDLKVRRPDISRLVQQMRPFVDCDFYRRQYEDLAGMDPVEHYVRYGWKEGRDPSASFSTRDHLRRNSDLRSAELFPFAHLFENPHWPNPSAKAEPCEDVYRRFETGPLAEEFRAAADLEPALFRPGIAPGLSRPHRAFSQMLPILRELREGQTPATVVIALSHGRSAEILRAGEEAAAHYGGLFSPDQVLVVLTGASENTAPADLPDGTRICALGESLMRLSSDNAARLLVDLLRGVEARRFLNIESALGWDMLHRYGRQMAQELSIGAYLSAEHERSETIGKDPGASLRDCIDFLDLILAGSDALAGDVRTRFGLTGERDCVHVVEAAGPRTAFPNAVDAALAERTGSHVV